MARPGAVTRFLAHLGWIVAVVMAPFLVACHESRSEARTVEPRLSAAGWAPFQPRMRGTAVAVPARPIAKVAETATDPRAWSDLSVARHEDAIRHDAPELLAEALTACDRALSLDPALPEALFNRSLILEKLGLRDDAREAWTTYLTHDSGPWAAEAREHIHRLTRGASFLERVDRADPAALRTLAQSDPQEARGDGTMTVLGRWGSAMGMNDVRGAERQLAIARELGAEVARVNGDRQLERSVAAIDAATNRALLAAAHVDYEKGLLAFQDGRPVDAEPLLRRAGDGFERGKSPMSYVARFFAENTVFEQGRHDDAYRALKALLAVAPAGLEAWRAQLLLQLGVCHTVRADWGEAIRLMDEGTTTLERLGEIRNAGFGHRVQAVIYDRTGDRRLAWKHRMLALRSVGAKSDLGLEKAVASIAHAALFRRDWRTAVSFLNIEIEIARRIGDSVQLADALLIRAGARSRLHDLAGAHADLDDSVGASSRAKDAAYRAYGRGAQSFVRAMLATSSEEATALLTEAIAFESTRGDRVNLPGLFLQRGRSRRDRGDLTGAAADFRSGVNEVETHRQSLQQGVARWGVFFSAEELFEEAIDLELQRNDHAAAFAIAERARARSLLDVYGRPPSRDLGRLPAGTVVVEYAALPSRLVTFVVDAGGVTAVSTPWDREAHSVAVDALSKAIQTSRTMEARRAASALYRRLIGPIAPRLLGATTIAFVPDDITATVPFSALIDEDGKYLIERHTILIAPSAALFEAATERRRKAGGVRSVLVIAGGEQLASAGREAESVARSYRTSVILQNEQAQFAEVTKHAADADVIHFAGHAVGDDSGLVPASMALYDRRVEAPEIAHLPLSRVSTVVLAGCGTARGERRGADGVISVAYGFLAGGAPSVVATLWPIDDDAAAQFFPRLHRRLAEGLSPAEALRSVQLESIRSGNVPASLWAAVQDIGS
jgi:CHAT domain-containing protein